MICDICGFVCRCCNCEKKIIYSFFSHFDVSSPLLIGVYSDLEKLKEQLVKEIKLYGDSIDFMIIISEIDGNVIDRHFFKNTDVEVFDYFIKNAMVD